MKKQLQLFLTPDDEVELSAILKEEVPGIQFLNGNLWQEYPDCRDGIEYCETGIVYLYFGSLEQLPTMRRKDGRVEGPTAGCVIQVLRPIVKDEVLLSGRVAVGIDDDDDHMRDFVSRVWRCVRSVGKIGVVRPDGKIDKHYLVGHHARKTVADGMIKIADRAVGLHYETA
ncbi:MAG: hypothetical protein DWQ31_19835 [Planctomycetota bacterium]|nr:MAG: hypothetical protein DWQ31_19835 [Planctomycetota bacterium]REK18064.1 MAG: hypothetical protein DWQ42_20980 [Planctomycetota bacterium]REK40216.1 MAG: hypothetical protein DWQ46_16870 [Planctomycetota bacterium]